MRELKSALISIGIGFLISVPIVRMATDSWNQETKSIFEEIPDYQIITSDEIERKAHEIMEAEKKRQELIDQELMRQERIEQEIQAEYILEHYAVIVPEDVRVYCDRAQEESNVCAELLEAVCWRESRFDDRAKNSGCLGMMQISTKWHEDRMKRLGVTDIYDPEENIRVGADYLAELFERFDGDVYKVLMTYNGDSSEGVSDYAIEICEVAAALERVHGK